MPLPLVLAPLVPAAKAVAANAVVKTGGALLGKKALMTGGARAAALLVSTPKVALPLAPKWLTPVVSVGVGAFSFLASIWASLNKPKVKPDAPTYPPVEGTFDVGVPAGAEGILKVRVTVNDKQGQLRSCSDDSVIQEAWNKTENRGTPAYRVFGPVSVTQKQASFNFECGSGGNYGEAVSLAVLSYTNSDGGTVTRALTPEYGNGGNKGGLYFTSPHVYTVTLEDWEFDETPLPNPIPTPKPEPQPLPDPVPMPEAEPAMVPEKPKVAPIVKPAPAEVPDAQPTTEPAPAPGPNKTPVKVPTRTPVTTPTKTPTLPATTTATTIAGAIVPASKAIVPTTPSDVHKFGNAGGRVAGRTASMNPTQMAQELGRVEQKLAQLAGKSGVMKDLADYLPLLNLIYNYLMNQKGGTTYELEAVCECPEDDNDCEEPKITLQTPGGDYREETLARIDAIAELLQPLKSWKQPICNEKPKLEGDFRTISFISDERSPDGNSRLRKRFRYRSQSGADLSTLVDHWKDFEWDAGPVCVQHSGHSWGTPQVWAASVDEGKRIIQHAGREAGVDPNQVGKWTVSGSNNPRFGMSGRMRVNTKGGYYWITERLGSSGKPLVVST